jgi:hypothetical protein
MIIMFRFLSVNSKLPARDGPGANLASGPVRALPGCQTVLEHDHAGLVLDSSVLTSEWVEIDGRTDHHLRGDWRMRSIDTVAKQSGSITEDPPHVTRDEERAKQGGP